MHAEHAAGQLYRFVCALFAILARHLPWLLPPEQPPPKQPAPAPLQESPSPPPPPPPLWQPLPPADGAPPERLLRHTQASFAAAARARLGRGERLARALYRAYYCSAGSLERAVASLPELRAAGELGAALHGLCDPTAPLSFACGGGAPPAPPADGETEKYVLCCGGGEEVEMVAMPAPGGRSWSLCVSSQVGCRMGCSFCETGRMGLLRNLSAAEIVAQAGGAAAAAREEPPSLMVDGL